MANPFYNMGTGLIDIEADSLTVDEITLSSGENQYSYLTLDNNNKVVIQPSSDIIFTFEGVSETDLQNASADANPNQFLINAGKDSSTEFQTFLDNIQTTRGTEEYQVNVKVEPKKGFMFLNDQISVPDFISLDFKSCPIFYGEEGTITVQGSFREEPSAIGDAPTLTAPTNSGSSSFSVQDNGFDMSSWSSGDLLAFRSVPNNAREDLIINTISGSSPNYTITTTETAGQNYIVGDTVRRFAQTKLRTNVERGRARFEVVDVNAFSTGNLIQIKDIRKAGDIKSNPENYSNNDFIVELSKLVQKSTSNNQYTIADPVSNFLDKDFVYLLRVNPRKDIVIKNLRIYYLDNKNDTTRTRQNNHGILITRGDNVRVENISHRDQDGDLNNISLWPNIDNIVRLRECYMCSCNGVTIDRYNNDFSGSGASYGVTHYYSSRCSFTDLKLNTLRHNILLQGANKSLWDNINIGNVLISGFDLHGLNERDNQVTNLYATCSESQSSVDNTTGLEGNTTIALIRLGNSFHPTGASYNTFDNCILKNGRPLGDIDEVYGIEVVPGATSSNMVGSRNNVFKNSYIEAVDTAITMSNHPRFLTEMSISETDFTNNLVYGASNIGISIKNTLDRRDYTQLNFINNTFIECCENGIIEGYEFIRLINNNFISRKTNNQFSFVNNNLLTTVRNYFEVSENVEIVDTGNTATTTIGDDANFFQDRFNGYRSFIRDIRSDAGNAIGEATTAFFDEVINFPKFINLSYLPDDPTKEIQFVSSPATGYTQQFNPFNTQMFQYFQNLTTGSNQDDGLRVGVDSSGVSEIRNYQNTDIDFYTNNLERMTIKNNGDVGIGTDNPVQELHIHDATANTRLQITNGTTGAASTDGIILGLRNNDEAVLINREATNLSFWTNNTQRLTINGVGGNVGIGTGNPSNLLHLYNSGGDVDLLFDDGTNTSSITQSSSALLFEVPTNSEIFRIDSNSMDFASGIDINLRNTTFNNFNTNGEITFEGGGTFKTSFRTTSTSSADSEIIIQGARNNSTTDDTSSIRFQNYDNDITSTDTLARIIARVEDTTNNNDGRLIIETRNNGNPVEALHIDNNGYIGINTSTMSRYFTLQHDNNTVGMEFLGNTGTGVNPVISSTALGTYFGKIKVLINGSRKWIGLYDD